MKKKVVYQIRQGLFSDGHTVFTRDGLTAVGGKRVISIKNLSQAPMGHPAREHNARLPRSAKEKITDNQMISFLTQAKAC